MLCILTWNVLRAIIACTFLTSQLPKVLRTRSVVHILTSKCALRHNGVHYFNSSIPKSAPKLMCLVLYVLTSKCAAISHLSSGQMVPHPPLWRAYFLTLQSHKSLEKHSDSSDSRLFYLFARLHLLSSDSFASLIFFLLLFSDVSRLCFSSVHIVGSLPSKLPSAMTVTCSNSLLKHVQHHLSYRHGPHLMASFLEAQGGHGKLRGGGNHKSNPLPPI